MARILSDYFIEVGCGCYIIPENECNDGDMESCYKAGLLCEDNATSFKLFEKACNGGCEEGCLSASEIIMQEDSKKGIRSLEKKL